MPTTVLNVVEAPGKSRPRMQPNQVQGDAIALARLLRACGIGATTEHILPADREALVNATGNRAVPGPGARPARVDSPICWTEDWQLIDHGVDNGCAGVLGIAPARYTPWLRLRHSDNGLVVGVVSTHMLPGGWTARPSRLQRLRRKAIRGRWQRHRVRIRNRLANLRKRCDVVLLLGDINRPRHTPNPWPLQHRIDRGDLVYLGVWVAPRHRWEHTPHADHAQEADHDAVSTVLTIHH